MKFTADFLQADLAIPPLKIVGYEGLFGSISMLFVMLPLVQHLPGVDGQGIHEDSRDTWHVRLVIPLKYIYFRLPSKFL